MKIYFACSIRGGRDDAAIYAEIAKIIATRATLLTEIFADGKLTAQGMDKPSSTIWQTDTDWIRQSDAIIAEVTNPSLGVGYEIAKAEEWGKPVLALYRPSDTRKLSAMVEGSPDTKTAYYDDPSQLETTIVAFINRLTNK